MTNNIAIENVYPEINCGSFYSKGTLGDKFDVYADVYKGGHETIASFLKYRKKGESEWAVVPMGSIGNDRWHGSFTLERIGMYEYTIEAYLDSYSTLLKDAESWYKAGEPVEADISRIFSILESARKQSENNERQFLSHIIDGTKNMSVYEILSILNDTALRAVALKYQEKKDLSTYKILKVFCDRKKATFSAWYELFPRSQGKSNSVSGTFKDVESRLDDIKKMGFDVLYLTPIHPIGVTNRRGKNGARYANKGDVGSPWAIGSSEGGHMDINSELGGIKDFEHLISEAKARDIEIAMDMAFQCSPDHPYVKKHPDWFAHGPDGKIKYAENPPKKYFDIYPIDFGTPDKNNLYRELKSVVIFWIEKGIRIFRVDNPHTKPFDFWNYLITEIKEEYPETLFLSEAFTRKPVMYWLGKIGFSMSYTYFTWRNYDYEIRDYFNELYSDEIKQFFRPMLFTNTPDILPRSLAGKNRNAFIIRSVLASTLSPLWGIYSGFELCENQPMGDSEEYLNSEKYEIRKRDWNASGNIRDIIGRLNLIRRENEALQNFGNLRFCKNDNHNILSYVRYTRDLKNVLIISVNLNPDETHSDVIHLPLREIGMNTGAFEVIDLLDGSEYTWNSYSNYVRLIPGIRQAHIMKVITQDA